ncbi:FMRFamide receptor [Biomphalaria glabrata]|nr:FMRFamide receptor [Biomphalaria glabrata]
MSTVNSTLSEKQSVHGLIPSPALSIILICNYLVIGLFVSALGTLGNLANIVIFTKEGYQDSVNITLSALAMSDIGALLLQMAVSVLNSPIWNDVDIPFLSAATLCTQFFYPRQYFIRVSGVITAFAACEKCLCVVFPMRVRQIITRNFAIGANCFICIILLLYFYPPYYSAYLDWGLDVKQNKTKITVYYRSNAEKVLRIAYLVSDLSVPYITFCILILCNAVIVVKLKSKSKWRQSVAVRNSNLDSKSAETSAREKKLALMLATVSTLFVVCLLPQSILLTCVSLVRELNLNGAYNDVTVLISSFTLLLENINCSINILVYYCMSTKYRKTFQACFLDAMKSTNKIITRTKAVP